MAYDTTIGRAAETWPCRCVWRGVAPPPVTPSCLEVDALPHDKHYNEARHRAWREAVLRRAGYLCEECKRYGRTDADGLPVRATTAHHIKHRDEYPELQYVISNGRALCEACHNKAHPEKGKGRYWS